MAASRGAYNGEMPSGPSRAGVSGEIAITLNGEPRTLPAPVTVSKLIRRLELEEDAVAIERNREIVIRTDWQGTLVCSGDKIEIVHFVGGG